MSANGNEMVEVEQMVEDPHNVQGLEELEDENAMNGPVPVEKLQVCLGFAG